MTVQTDVAPFGFVEEIWGVEKFLGYEGAETEELFLPTTDGLYVCMITQTGQFLYSMESYYEGLNVINALVINEDELVLSFFQIEDNESLNKVVIFNLETKQEKMVIDLKSAQIFDICTIPGNPGGEKYFMMHTGKGIQLVNSEKRKTYDLVHCKLSDFNVCKSISVQAMD